MSPHPRLRRIAKWTGLTLCVLILVAWIASECLFIEYVGRTAYVGVPSGCVKYVEIANLNRPSGWVIELPHEFLDLRDDPEPARHGLQWPVVTRAFGRHVWIVPFWPALALVAFPTAVLWWRDRRRIPPGHCAHCGYNLSGNVSGICPECGTKIPADQRPPQVE
jgi:hypothetical protein